ncbi:probable LRR receptor-like serine/threonine-protein kinase At1g56140 isoform X2 [Phragmites australis]|uniref:probable LRR receptor-like serine/threonine-protein kinase At1g56140 isoform X2 n=1 Tax=Phragmites australis TaxID=29695 RepID=UPI002D76C47D|nr:probable LRR receptor-like serine/threonine-protein kinase At1g56140 isoform X2 [Phragmites australis]XP_062225458.1 probable LRR receptor-like serine/threonine-protein kinase At1g56140 isoform X2 [Phragmites australis]
MKAEGISLNNFTGTLPSELGNLAKLGQLYFDSSGFSGPFPSTFSKLKNLKTLWAADNDFIGKMPDFIGSLTKLQDLRFQGNFFQGPIPASLSNLTNLTSLQIGDCNFDITLRMTCIFVVMHERSPILLEVGNHKKFLWWPELM